MEEQSARVSLIGHSHVALFFTDADGPPGAAARPPAGAVSWTISEDRWLLNPGSVGQPRDGDPRAAWLELDTDEWTRDLPPGRLRHRRGGGGDPRGRAPDLLADRLYVGHMRHEVAQARG